MENNEGITITKTMESTSVLKAIRLKCLDCCCDSAYEVKLCPCEKCPLHPFRFGKNPYRSKKEYTEEQLEKMRAQGLDPKDFEFYLQAHKYGLPPHGGLGIGLERLVMKLIGAQNVRQASMFPRDLNRLMP